MGYVDGYCERVAPGLLGEPLNSLSNLAFLAAALLTWWLARSTGRRAPATTLALPVLITLIFVGSAVFHTTATPLGGALDSGFIAVFLLYYVSLFANLFLAIPWRLAWIASAVFVILTALVTLAADLVDFDVPGMYLAALLALFVLAALLRRPRRSGWAWFAGAGAVFTVSLAFRTIDEAVCPDFPAGTHFLWHLLNALTLYLVTRAAITRWKRDTE